MAVARIHWPDKAAAKQAAAVLREHRPDLTNGIREIERALERRVPSSELTSLEMRCLAAVLSDLYPRSRGPVRKAMEELEAAEEHDAARPRGPELTQTFTARPPTLPLHGPASEAEAVRKAWEAGRPPGRTG